MRTAGLLGTRDTIAGTVYGTIVLLAALTAGARLYDEELWRLIAVAGSTVVVLWLAHVYAHALGESLRMGRRLSTDERRAVARRELSILLAAVAPLSALTLGAVGVLDPSASVWLAFGIGLATLGVQGARYARLERLGGTALAVSVLLNVGLGLVLVLLKVLVMH